ncbi:MAG TPA: hypothetical protein VKG01_00595 [Thermoanaerobaculia bacterium]|nr:hypothetical protein [Thermoanaerobaculia bacterium]
MKRIDLPVRELGFVIATRAALGAGIGLLLSRKLGDKSKAVGIALVTLGALTTIPALIAIRRSSHRGPRLWRVA